MIGAGLGGVAHISSFGWVRIDVQQKHLEHGTFWVQRKIGMGSGNPSIHANVGRVILAICGKGRVTVPTGTHANGPLNHFGETQPTPNRMEIPMTQTTFTLLAVLTSLTISITQAEDGTSLIEPGETVKKLAGGMGFTEGPAWLPKERQARLFRHPQQQTHAVDRRRRFDPFFAKAKTRTGTFSIFKVASFRVSMGPET